MSEPPQGRCSLCDAPIIWARTIDGTQIPLDAAMPVYRLTIYPPFQATRAYRTYVAHWKTCTKPGGVTKKRSRADDLLGT